MIILISKDVAAQPLREIGGGERGDQDEEFSDLFDFIDVFRSYLWRDCL